MSHIVHFGKYYFPDAGGIESVTESLARGVAALGHRVTVVCFRKSPAPARSSIAGVEVVRAPLNTMVASQPLSAAYVRSCLQQARDADVVHLHTPNMLGALACLMLPRHCRLVVQWHADVINKGWLGRLLRPLEAAVLRRADVIVATSQVYVDNSAPLQPFLDKVQVVPLGVPDPLAAAHQQQPLPAALEQRLQGKKLILAVGRLVPYKGFDVLIKAARHLSEDTVVMIVGGGALQEELQQAIQAQGVADRVCLVGRQSDETLHGLFKRAAIYCLSSVHRAEAFGVVLLEAMAYGVPVVATRIPGSGVPWVNEDGVSGLNVAIDDPEALAQACNQILASNEEHARFSAGARQRFLHHFTEGIFVHKMLDAYALPS